MNSIIDINRTTLLFKRYFVENKKEIITSWSIATIFFLFFHMTEPAIIFCLISGLIFAGKSFKFFNTTPKGIHFLMLPATHFEKLFVTICISTLYLFAQFVITFCVGSTVGALLTRVINETGLLSFTDTNLNPFERLSVIFNQGFLTVFWSFALIQSIFILGSITFKRNAVGLTILTLFALSVAVVVFEVFFFKVFIGDMHLSNHQFHFSINNMGDNNIVGNIIYYAIVPLLWTISYFKLTEKEL